MRAIAGFVNDKDPKLTIGQVIDILNKWTEADQTSFVDYMSYNYTEIAHPSLGLDAQGSVTNFAQIYISYSVKSIFFDFVDCLDKFHRKNHRDVSYWLDFLIVNNWKDPIFPENWHSSSLKILVTEIILTKIMI